MSTVRFEEKQRFRQAWIYAALFVLDVPVTAFLGLVIVASAESVADAAWILVLVAALVAGGFLLVYVCSLRISVTDDVVRFRFFPFHLRERRIPSEEIESVQRGRDDNWPSGLGVRWTPHGWHYRVSLEGGVSLERTTGKPVFLGSEHEDELYRAIQEASRLAR